MKSNISSAMKMDVYKALWFLIHFFVDFYLGICRLWKQLCHNINELLFVKRRSLSDDKEMIESARSLLKKIPKHLVVVLGIETPDYRILSQMIFWSLSVGIQQISFYDHKGILVSNNYKMYEYLSKWKKANEKIVWNANNGGTRSNQIIYKNGLMKELSVNFLSAAESKRRITEISRQMAHDRNIQADDINVEFMNKKFTEIIDPEPELAIYFGDVCSTYGLLPWHIRLTEFIGLPSQKSTTARTFVQTIAKYAKCEQRFGK